MCAAALEPDGNRGGRGRSADGGRGGSGLSGPAGRLWPTNYSKYAAATMFTLFFGGETFAPGAVYDGPEREFAGRNVGFVLRTAYIRAYTRLLRALAPLPNVLGIDPFNEPHPGYIGLASLHAFDPNTDLHLGHMPSALQSMALAAGVPTNVPFYARSWPGPSRLVRHDTLNAARLSAYLPGRADVWRAERVFAVSGDDADCVTLGPRGAAYFASHPVTGAAVDFGRDFYVPFVRDFHAAVRAVARTGRMDAWLFVEPVPNMGGLHWPTAARARDTARTSHTDTSHGQYATPSHRSHSLTGPEKVCFAPHWYDIRALYEKRLAYGVSLDVLALARGSRNLLRHAYFGRAGLARNYAANFRRLWRQRALFSPHAAARVPLLVGETGVPWDLDRLAAYRTGDVHLPLLMTDALLHAMERAGVTNWTFWNVTLAHRTHAARDAGACRPADNEAGAPLQAGDGWNSEDFSIVSADPATTELPLCPCRCPSPCRRRCPSPPPGPRSGPRFGPHDRGQPLTRAALFGELYRGLRGAPAFLRPYAVATAGRLLRAEFLLDPACRFDLEYSVSLPSEDDGCQAGEAEEGEEGGKAGGAGEAGEAGEAEAGEEGEEGEESEEGEEGEEGKKGEDEEEKTRTTECFVPAYHYWGRPVVARFWVRPAPSQSQPLSSAAILAAEEVSLKWDRMHEQSIAGGHLAFAWDRARQALNIVHRRGFAGSVGLTLVVVGDDGVHRRGGPAWSWDGFWSAFV